MKTIPDLQGIDQLVSPVLVKHSYVNYDAICLALIFEGTSWYIALIVGGIATPTDIAKSSLSLPFAPKTPKMPNKCHI